MQLGGCGGICMQLGGCMRLGNGNTPPVSSMFFHLDPYFLQGNRHFFLTLIWLHLYAAVVSAIVGAVQIQRYVYSDRIRPGAMVWLLSFEIINVFVGIGLAGLGIAQASQVARNVTTNELANWHR